jgi:hypothetical protein
MRLGLTSRTLLLSLSTYITSCGDAAEVPEVSRTASNLESAVPDEGCLGIATPPLSVTAVVVNDTLSITLGSKSEPVDVRLTVTVLDSEGKRIYPNVAAANLAEKANTQVALPLRNLGIAKAKQRDTVLYVTANPRMRSETYPDIHSKVFLRGGESASRMFPVTESSVLVPGRGVRMVAVEPSVAFSTADTAFMPSADGAVITAAVTKKVCFFATRTLDENNKGEDYWLVSPGVVAAKGMWLAGRRAGQSPPATWLALQLDQSGCLTRSWDTGSWEFQAVSFGLFAGTGGATQVLDVRDQSQGDVNIYDAFTATISTGTGTQNITYTASVVPTTFLIAHAALTSVAAALTTRTLGSSIVITANNSTGSSGNENGVKIHSTHTRNKWAVAHEVGHLIFCRESNTPIADFGYDADLAVSGVATECNNATGPNHTLYSREKNSAAHVEGFANFFSAAIWNNPNDVGTGDATCVHRFLGRASAYETVSCSGSSKDYLLRVMESNCADKTPPVTAFTGHGNEADWARVYWHQIAFLDLLTPPTQATMRQILDVVERANSWNSTNHYTQMNTAMGDGATPQHLEDRWNGVKDGLGIDW